MSPTLAPFTIDAELCVGHGRCYALAPGVFEADDMGCAHLRTDIKPEDVPEDRDAIVNACPEGAIDKT